MAVSNKARGIWSNEVWGGRTRMPFVLHDDRVSLLDLRVGDLDVHRDRLVVLVHQRQRGAGLGRDVPKEVAIAHLRVVGLLHGV